MNNEQNLLQSALYEIKNLREANKIMSARLDMFDKVMQLFHSPSDQERNGVMMGRGDIVWEIEERLKVLSVTDKLTGSVSDMQQESNSIGMAKSNVPQPSIMRP